MEGEWFLYHQGADTQILYVVQGQLIEYWIEPKQGLRRGDILWGRLSRVSQSLQAAFVEFGPKEGAFLPLDQLPESFARSPGVTLPLEVIRAAEPPKRALVTAFCCLPSHALIYTLHRSSINTSKRWPKTLALTPYRRALEQVGATWGWILRSQAALTSPERLGPQATQLLALWKEKLRHPQVGELLHAASHPLYTAAHSGRWPCPIHLTCRTAEHAAHLKSVLQGVPEWAQRVRVDPAMPPLLMWQSVLAPYFSPTLALPSGGVLRVAITPAAVTIDVDAGAISGNNQAAWQCNREALPIIAHLLRLRQLSGIIMIDFMKLKCPEDRLQLRVALKKAVLSDPAQITLGEEMPFGVLLLTRQHCRTPLHQYVTHTCPQCQQACFMNPYEVDNAQ